jgi:protein-tyrosine-phosphatase
MKLNGESVTNNIVRGVRTLPGEQRWQRPARNVLFICSDNARASIIAEALLKRWGGRHFQAYSAGSAPAAEVHPLTQQVLSTQRVWRPELKSKSCEEFLRSDSPQMDFIISLGERAPDGLPTGWPGNPRIMHWRITEPVLDGTPTERTHAFKKTFTELETRVRLFTLVNTRELGRRAAA